MNSSLKIYRENSYLTELKANVLSCIKNGDFYEVILDKTIFYPHMSGGQPKDEGTINGIKVTNVIEKDDEIIHILSEPVDGTVSLTIDFETRFDYMQQHTGQHILSSVFADLYNGKTVGFHLSSNYTTIDLDINLTDDMVDHVEMCANQIVFENKIITATNYPYDEALKLNLRKPPMKLDYLRIIEIQDKDIIACGGTHVKSTVEVGIIKIVKAEKYKSGTRVEFLCGKRALTDYALKHKDIVNLSTLMSCRTDMIFDNFIKIKNENKELKKNIISMQNIINNFIVKDLKESTEIINNVHFIFKHIYNIDAKDLRFICSKAVEDSDYAAILICEAGTTCAICIGQSSNLNFDLKSIFEKCKTLINAKGGGNDKLVQGTGTILNKSEEWINLVRSFVIN